MSVEPVNVIAVTPQKLGGEKPQRAEKKGNISSIIDMSRDSLF